MRRTPTDAPLNRAYLQKYSVSPGFEPNTTKARLILQILICNMWGVGGIFLTQLPPIANVYESVFPSCLITFRFTNLKKAPRPKKATMLSTNPSKPVPKGTHDQVRALKDLDPDNTDDNAFKLVTHIIDFLPILLVVKISYKIMFSRALSHLSSFPTTPRSSSMAFR